MSTHEIPGLIASQNTQNQGLNFDDMLSTWHSDLKNQVFGPAPQSLPKPSPPPYYQPGINNTYIDYESLKKTRVAQQTVKDYQEAIAKLNDYLSKEKTQKSPVAALLDDLFDPVEKTEFLESLGYRYLPNSSYMVKGEVDPEFKRTFTMEEAFYIEMRIKLKNILLSKQALKFKI